MVHPRTYYKLCPDLDFEYAKNIVVVTDEVPLKLTEYVMGFKFWRKQLHAI